MFVKFSSKFQWLSCFFSEKLNFTSLYVHEEKLTTEAVLVEKTKKHLKERRQWWESKIVTIKELNEALAA